MLCLPQQDVAGYRTFQSSLESPVMVQQHQTDAIVRASEHERGRNHDVSQAYNAAKVV
jgi:hypothetical protein